MSYDMKDPKERAVTADRRAAGIGPIMGGSREVVRALKKSRRISRRINPTPFLAKEISALPDYLQPMSGLRQNASRIRPETSPWPAVVYSFAPRLKDRFAYYCVAYDHTPRAKPAIDPSSMAGIPAFYREPDWSEASDDDEHDPASPLPYCPRWNISTRRLDAIWTAATTTTPKTLAAHEKEQARLAANAQTRRAQKNEIYHGLEKASRSSPAPDDENWYINIDGSGLQLVLRSASSDFPRGLAYLGVGVEDDRHFWVVNGDATIHRSSGSVRPPFKLGKIQRIWASIFVTSLEEDAESYALQFDSEKRVALLSVLSRPQPHGGTTPMGGFPFRAQGPWFSKAAPPPKSKARPLKSPIPFEMFLRVVAFCPLRERAVITRLQTAAPPVPPYLVISLIFADDVTSVEVLEWMIVLPALVNLWRLGITSRIPLPRPHAIPSVSSYVLPGHVQLVAPGKTSLLPNPGSANSTWTATFAVLFRIRWCCPTSKVSKLGHRRGEICSNPPSLRCMDFGPDFLLLSAAAPEFVEVLRHLALDEDLTWSDFTLESGADCIAGSTFGRVATTLDGQFIHLKSVLLISSSCTQSIIPGRWFIRWRWSCADEDLYSRLTPRMRTHRPVASDLQCGEHFLPLPLPSVGPHFGCTVTYSSTNHSSPYRSPSRQGLLHQADGEATECAWAQSRRLRVAETVNSDPDQHFHRFSKRPISSVFHLGSSTRTPWIALSEEDYDDMPALEDDLSDNSCCVDSLKSKL
ncbi:hypothetical protein B0H14DRAFT_2629891 [Mycena olivaceomarginata]|nr:hypothetical protein B0H14DRAFT_2629891 [Mycena olivaceomarginata]